LHILDTNASHDLIIAPGSNITADRTLTITTGDANRTLDISAASVTISSFGATLVDDADASTARTTLGLVIGTDVQAFDELLNEIAALSTDPNADSGLFFDDSANAMAYWTPSSPLAFSGTSLTVSAGTTSAAGVLEIATSAEWRTGTDTARGLGVAETWGAAAEVTLTDAATIAVDFATGINFVVTLTANRAMGNPTNEKVGQSGYIRIVQDAGGTNTLSFGTDWEFAGGVAPSISTGGNDQNMLFYTVIASNRVLGHLFSDIA
jgi:hypothetical protein